MLQGKETDRFFYKNEIRNNLHNSNILLICAGLMLLSCLFFLTGIWKSVNPGAVYIIYLIAAIFGVGCALLCRQRLGRDPWLKYLMIFGMLIGGLSVGILSSGISFMILLLPIALSCGYYSPRLTLITSGMTAVAMCLASVLKTFVKAELFHDPDVRFIILPEGTQITIQGQRLYTTFAYMDYDKLLYLRTEAVNELLPSLLVLAVLTVVCVLIASQGRDAILQQRKESERKAALETALSESRTQTMVSQIQPHFIFNVLNTIYELCDEEPETAQKAIDEFSTYLRLNVDTLGSIKNIPFTKELEHIKTYLSLEQLRFGERIRTKFDIQTENFEIPPLSLQPLVENAVKHGVCRRKEGGTIWISTQDRGNAVYIIIADDGVGFDLTAARPDAKTHVGLENARERLRLGCRAEMKVESTPGAGTRIEIAIPKEKPDESNHIG